MPPANERGNLGKTRPKQARYGSSVASYFHFYRWLVGTYIFIASMSLVWIVFHILKQVNQGRSTVFSANLVGQNSVFSGFSTSMTNILLFVAKSSLVFEAFSAVGMDTTISYRQRHHLRASNL